MQPSQGGSATDEINVRASVAVLSPTKHGGNVSQRVVHAKRFG